MIAQAKTFFNSLSVTAKIGLTVGAAFLLIVTAGVLWVNVSGAVSQYRSKKADEKVAAKQKEIDGLNRQIDDLNKSAAAKEAQGQVKDAEVEALRQQLTNGNSKAQEQERKITDAAEQLKSDSVITDSDSTDAVRRERICAKLKSAGIQVQCQ